jgi:transposase
MSRYNLNDYQWDRIKKFFPDQNSKIFGRPSKDHRVMIDAMIWILRTGAPWRDLPAEFGSWKSVYTRFRRWRVSGLFEKILNAVSEESDEESVIVDSSVIRAHQHAAGAKGGRSIRPWGGQKVDSLQKSTQ